MLFVEALRSTGTAATLSAVLMMNAPTPPIEQSAGKPTQRWGVTGQGGTPSTNTSIVISSSNSEIMLYEQFERVSKEILHSVALSQEDQCIL